jgi:4-hydroxy-tetrahydrodipicolinate synthase
MLGEVLTAVVTPFNEDGSVNFERFRELCAHLVDNGSDGVVVAGTTGESPTLSDDERLELFAAAVEAVGERATVVAGTGTYSTAHSVHLTEKAHALGVDGFLVVTPYYNKPPPRGIVEHFKAIAQASDKPIIVYNIPGRVVLNIEPETIAKLAEIPTVRAVKQANPDLEQARRIVDEIGLALYAGDDNLVFPFLELGGTGGVCVHTHVVGPQVKEMIRRYRDGDADGARRIDEELEPIYELLKVVVNPIAIKAALASTGWDVGGLRLPLVEASEEERARIAALLARAGALETTARA